ncbi:MAG: lysine--tRNA ligase [Lentisphaerae bacterium]|nr:lysine--tRNA ligase [Lentisphaerota bacterium]
MTDSLSTEPPAPHPAHERDQRVAKLSRFAAQGRPPYGRAFEVTGPLAEIRAGFAEGRAVRATGRLITHRDMGKSIFADLHDGSDRFQVYAHKPHLGDEPFLSFKMLDMGDCIGVEGELFTTRTGERSIRIARWTLLAKSLRPLPEKWHGLKDIEIRYRRRYLDLIANPGVRDLFRQRSRIVAAIRTFLWDRGFMEVETPMMQPQAGGAAARPFRTHYTALNADMVLRIAPELYLKRLLIGGLPKVFELNRNFRNEGLSKTHNPEFTMLEIYEAYSDVRGMKRLIEALIVTVAEQVMGTLQVGEGDLRLDLALPWREVPYRDLIREKMGADWFELSRDAMREKAEALGLAIEPAWDAGAITHEIYEKLVEKSLKNPTFVTRLPAALVPLARVCDDDPTVVDVFELVIGGKEIAPAYSELNDPLEQRKRLEAQAGEAGQPVDEDFLAALEYGMPPAGGMGVGIDRLVMILTGAETIRDVILFPQLRIKKEDAGGDSPPAEPGPNP